MFENLAEEIVKADTINRIGKIENIVGMAMEASGGNSNVGDIVKIYSEEKQREITAEVVGFRNDRIQLMAYDNIDGIGSNSLVMNTNKRLKITVG